MRVLYPRCAGLDVHKRTVVACRMFTNENGAVTAETRTFGTTTADLLVLLDWLVTWGCTHVAMESTGAYWKPVYNLLEGSLELLLVNARHCRNVPGRKTDVKDAEWLADLLRHGLLKASYVPDQPQRDLRDLTRGRSLLVGERARTLNRLQAMLEGANIKLASVVSQIDGVSARDMLQQLAAGNTEADELAKLGRGQLRKKREELRQALTGRFREHHQFLLTQYLGQLDFYEEQIALFDAQIAERMELAATKSRSDEPEPPEAPPSPSGGRCFQEAPNYAKAVALLDGIPGIAIRGAQAILAETGLDMRRFPTPAHLTSWAGVAPGNDESAGKRRSGKVTPGNPALRKSLIQAAQGAARTKDGYFNSLYHRLASRRGKKRAMVAVARSLLVVIYHMLLFHEPYRELGGSYFDERKKEGLVKSLVQRLQNLGYQAELQPLPVT
jgi:transposase